MFVDAGAFPADGSSGTGAFGPGTLTNGMLDAALDAYDFETGEPVAVSASIHVEIVGCGEAVDFLLRNADLRFSARGTTLDLEGTLTIGDMSFTPDGAGGFTPLPGACVDDVPVQPIGRTLQSAVTWQTTVGLSYYVQIGGFPEAFAYGSLRVAVR